MTVRDRHTEYLRIQAYRRMSGEEKIELAAQMFEDGVQIVRDSILFRNPSISEEELNRQIRRRVLPRDLAEKVERYLQERRRGEHPAGNPAFRR